MGHSSKTNILSESNLWCSMKSVCGISRSFSTGNQADTWLRIHRKKCDICKNNNNKLKVNHHPLQIIDPENKQLKEMTQ